MIDPEGLAPPTADQMKETAKKLDWTGDKELEINVNAQGIVGATTFVAGAVIDAVGTAMTGGGIAATVASGATASPVSIPVTAGGVVTKALGKTVAVHGLAMMATSGSSIGLSEPSEKSGGKTTGKSSSTSKGTKGGTRFNPDGTSKNPAEQLKQIETTQTKIRQGKITNKIIESTSKSNQNLKSSLKRIKNVQDAIDEGY